MHESDPYPYQLLDVRLFEARIDRLEKENPVLEDGESKIQLAYSKSINKDAEKDLISVLLQVVIDGSDQEKTGYHIEFSLEGLFNAIQGDDEVDEVLQEEFEEISSVSLLWPYVREYLHNFSWRMRLEIPVLPTLNSLSTLDKPEDEISSDDER